MLKDHLQKAASILGSQAQLAREIGASPAMIHHWMHGIRPISAERCIDIERATGGAVTCEELRPDLADRWAYLRGTATPDALPSSQDAA